MRLFFTNLFTTFYVGAVLSGLCGVDGRTIPLKQEAARRRSASPASVEVSGLDVLKSYVCTPCADSVKRQVEINVRAAASVNIPAADIPELMQEVMKIMVDMQNTMKSKGIPVPTAGAAPTAAARRRGDPSAAEIAALPILKTYVCPACSNSTKRQETNYLTNLTNATPDDLIALYQQLIVLLQQLVVILNSSSSTFSTSTTPASMPTSISASFETRTTSRTDNRMSFTSGSHNCHAPSTVYRTTYIPASAATTATVAPRSTSTPTASAAASSTTGTTGLGGQPNYVFNAQSTNNVAVYFGQTPITGSSSLKAQCSDPNIDIVILAFVIGRDFAGGKYPQVNFGAACGGQTAAMESEAPGLLYCPDLAADILTCQQTYGKKILLSIGGATSGISFPSQSAAVDFGNILWQLFGPPGNIELDLRPFGNVSIDGFDVDNENNMPANYAVLGSTLRAAYQTDNSKTYYLSSAPQCPFPDASDPMPMLLLCDFVFVQFYNNAPCEIGSAGFNDSVLQWATSMTASTLNPKPRVYLGAPSWSLAGPSAYTHIGTPEGMMSVAKSVQSMGLGNFGGVMFWDGPEGQANTGAGRDILSWAKEGLVGSTKRRRREIGNGK